MANESHALLKGISEARAATARVVRRLFESFPLLREFLICSAAVVAACIAGFGLDPVFRDPMPWLPFFLAVLVIVRFTGLLVSVVGIIVSVLVADWFFLEPRSSLLL